jgi:lactobin A/cerein 7B family class IIb bacteriocin
MENLQELQKSEMKEINGGALPIIVYALVAVAGVVAGIFVGSNDDEKK